MSVQETPPRGWRALRAPRRFRCYALPEGFTPPAGERAAALARAAADALCVGPVTPVCREIGRHVWLCAFLHGADRRHWLATYEDGRPAGLDYVPRRAYLAILDWPHAYLYLAGPDDARAAALLQAFNGTLFPDRRPAEPFRPLRFDLAPLWLLPPEARRPADPAARWSELRLKGLAWREPGRGGALGQRQWPLDGFDELDGTGDEAAKYIDDSFGNRDPGQTENYDAFIIALGDDELNLDCFRNVMSDIRRELIDRAAGKGVGAIDPKKKLTILVHLREKGNAERLYWAAEREIEDIKNHVDVRAYGAREDVYTYNEIVNDAEAIEMNNEYNLAAGWAGNKNRFELWRERQEFDKWSSKAASAFYDTLVRLEKAAELVCTQRGIKDEEARLICSRLSGVAEHRRWSRFLYVNGFVVHSRTDKYNLVHKLLKSFSDLGDAQAYNDANGIVAKKCVEERDPEKTV